MVARFAVLRSPHCRHALALLALMVLLIGCIDRCGSETVSLIDGCPKRSEIPVDTADTRAVLLEFFQATGGTRWGNSSGWGTASNYCSWYGVLCTGDSVSALFLQDNNLSGTIPTVLGTLSSLYVLVVPVNSLNGTIPAEIGFMDQLVHVDLSLNEIYGTIPTEIGCLKNLRYLSVQNAVLIGTIPSEITLLTNLTTLKLGGNSLNGTIPSHIMRLPNLLDVDLSSNSLEGTIPATGPWSENLIRLDLSQNLLGGPFPVHALASKNLELFHIYENSFTGFIPSVIGDLLSLTDFDVSDNHFTGTLPTEIGLLHNLTAFFVSRNQFDGTIPREFGNLEQMRYLMLSECAFVGPIPTELGQLTSLVTLWLNQNHLTGTIPSQFENLKSISSIQLNSNALVGTIPSHLGSLLDLSVLYLQENYLVGTLPTELGQLVQMQEFKMEVNGLSGTIPTELGNMNKLVYLSLQYNNMSGTIPPSIGNLHALREVRLHNNQLDGPVPPEFCLGPSHILMLDHNHLSGPIPDCLGQLEQIDLSFNELNGTVDMCAQARVGPNTLSIRSNKLESFRVCSDKDPGFRWASTILRILDVSNNPFLVGNRNFIGEFCSSYSALISFFASLERDEKSGRTFEQFAHEKSVTAAGPEDISMIDLSGLASCIAAQEKSSPLTFLQLNGHDFFGTIPVSVFAAEGPLIINTSLSTFQPAPADVVASYQIASMYETLQYSSMVCREILTVGSVALIGLDPSYTSFKLCSCASGYIGNPPYCYPIQRKRLQIAIPIIVCTPLLILILILSYNWKLRKSRSRLVKVSLRLYPLRDKILPSEHDTPPPACDSEVLITRKTLAKEMDIEYRSLDILKEIANGASGTVFLARWNHKMVAVKKYHAGVAMNVRDFQRESGIHLQLRHPNIVSLYGVCLNPLCTVTEFMSRGSLYLQLKRYSGALRLHSESIALEIALGMNYLHSRGIMHRDLKSLNVLIDSDYHAKVCDFGASREDARANPFTENVGTAQWMAPETFTSGGGYSKACDVYSYGIVLWELAAGSFDAYPDLRFSTQVMQHVRAGGRPHLPEKLPDVYRNLITSCWDADPLHRPSFVDIVRTLQLAVGVPLRTS